MYDTTGVQKNLSPISSKILFNNVNFTVLWNRCQESSHKYYKCIVYIIVNYILEILLTFKAYNLVSGAQNIPTG